MASHNVDHLIVGNSAAGLAAAEAIRETSDDASVLIVGAEPYPAYGRPLISYMIEGKTDRDKIWLKDEGYYERLGFKTLLGPQFKVVGLDAPKHRALLENGDDVAYGKCLLATGSVPFMPPIEGLDKGSNVYSFMTLDDAEQLWKAAKEMFADAKSSGRRTRVVVIGAGLIGLKAAEAISGYADEVLVLELAPRILPAVLDEQGAAILQGRLAEEGIVCMPGVSAERLVLKDGKVAKAMLTDGRCVDCDIVVAAVGVRPNSSLATDAGAEQGRGLICSSTMQTTLPDVYAAGDIVQVTDVLDGSTHPLALWPNAVQQGRLAGLHMASSPDAHPYSGGFAVNAVDFFDASLLTCGVINPPDDGGYDVKVVANGDEYAKYVIKDGRLYGYILLNKPNNAGIYTSLIENATPLDTVDEAVFDGDPMNIHLEESHRWNRLHKGYPSDRDKLGWSKAVTA